MSAHVKTCQLLHQLPYHIFLALLLKQSNKFHSLFKDPMNFSQIFKPWNLDFQFQRLSTTITVCMNPVCTMPCLVLVLVAWRFKIKREWKERNLFLVGHIHMVIPSLWFFATALDNLLSCLHLQCSSCCCFKARVIGFFFQYFVLSKGIEPFMEDLTRPVTRPCQKRGNTPP